MEAMPGLRNPKDSFRKLKYCFADRRKSDVRTEML